MSGLLICAMAIGPTGAWLCHDSEQRWSYDGPPEGRLTLTCGLVLISAALYLE